MAEVENSCPEEEQGEVRTGTGLANIRAVAERYGGAVTVERNGGTFRLNVLFIISQHPGDIS